MIKRTKIKGRLRVNLKSKKFKNYFIWLNAKV